MATLNPLNPLASWTLLPGMVCITSDENGGGGDEFETDEGDEDDEDEDDDEGDKSKDKSKDKDDEDDDETKNLDEGARGILRKERKAARQAKGEAARLQRELDALKAKHAGKKNTDEEDDAEREKEAEARGAKAGQELAIRSSVRAALLTAGLATGDDSAKAVKRAMRLVDLEDLTIEEDGSIDGLDDAIADLKEDMPGLFRRSKKRRSINGGDDRGGDKTPPAKSASERQAAALAKKG